MRITIVLLSFLVFACGSSSNNSESGEIPLKDLKNQVMDVHDEVMPKMGTLRKASKSLRQLADSTQNMEYSEVATLIEKANEDMMNWMRAFDPNFTGSDQEIRDYLNQQKSEIEMVRKAINGSLEKSEELLAQ